MVRAGTLTLADLDAIACYCENWFISKDALEDIQRSGATIEIPIVNKAGDVVGFKRIANPSFRVYQDCQKILQALMNQFGFTPKARMGIKVADKPKKESTIMKLLSGPSSSKKAAS